MLTYKETVIDLSMQMYSINIENVECFKCFDKSIIVMMGVEY